MHTWLKLALGNSNDVTKCVREWMLANGMRSLPMWRDPIECIIRDRENIVEDGHDFIILGSDTGKEDCAPFCSLACFWWTLCLIAHLCRNGEENALLLEEMQ